jgi:cytochrome c biogenesis protein CcmG/thiol:disulfide interchange protein DsbE
MDIKKRTPFLLTIIGIPIFFITVLQAKDQSSPSPKISSAVESFRIQRFEEKRVAPPFTLKSLEGKTIALSDFKGKPVLLVFWATWCPTCKEELPLLEKFSEGKRDQLAILMVTVDGEREKKAQKIIKENKITLPVALLLKEKVMENYGVKGWIPLIFLIDPEGLIVGKIVGPRDWSKPEAWSALKEIFSLH